MPDQPMQGSTADYCSAYPGEPHHLVAHMSGGALVHVQRCSLCGWIDHDHLDAQVRERVAEGRRQATEGWDRQWAVQTPAMILPIDEEDRVRRHAARSDDYRVVSRLVGPWEPTEQAGGTDG